ncbi:MAG: putative RNA-binding protein, contains TRAM domain protein [halophilic archaeon J07HX5]|jgi:Predicted RNA-binding protein, contains TRAM domain|nr:MAG: putative RNA-binding protein, contains TRAM domain protein [halophilic archaeon J07HX5]
MVEIDNSLKSLFTATVRERDGRFVIELPEREIDHGVVQSGETYRVAVLPSEREAGDGAESETRDKTGTDQRVTEPPAPPVDEGEVREVTVESLGDQGDGIAKVERGYVVIVPGTRPGDTPTVRIEDVRENVAFATIVDETE